MHVPMNINDLLSKIESDRLEFKSAFNPEPILHTICAFANDFQNFGGGYIIVGISDDNGKAIMPPVGVELDQVDSLHKAEADRIFNYPYPAIEEALGNAVYHRDYEIREPIEVRIRPTSITIVSHPGPDASITDANLSTGKISSRRYRNRRIGEFLKELGLTEGRGTGIPKIYRSLKSKGSPSPAHSFIQIQFAKAFGPKSKYTLHL